MDGDRSRRDDREERSTAEEAGGGERAPVRGEGRGAGRQAGARGRSVGTAANADIEGSETDGKGTGRTGEDAGGYGPIPGSEGGI